MCPGMYTYGYWRIGRLTRIRGINYCLFTLGMGVCSRAEVQGRGLWSSTLSRLPVCAAHSPVADQLLQG